MAAGEKDEKPSPRPSIKSNISFNNYPKWKDKLRENCYKRVRADRTRLLWKTRLPDSKDHSVRHEELIRSTFQDIVSDELRKIKDTPTKSCAEAQNPDAETGDDILWEYDGLHAAYQGECEEILLEMQKIFYEDLKSEHIGKDGYIKVWEDEEDEYLACAVFENMQLNDKKTLLLPHGLIHLKDNCKLERRMSILSDSQQCVYAANRCTKRFGVPYASKESCNITRLLSFALFVKLNSMGAMRLLWSFCGIDWPKLMDNILIGGAG